MYELMTSQCDRRPDRGRATLRLMLTLGLVTLLMALPLITPMRASAAGGEMEFGTLPLSFVPNVGQTDSRVHFQVHDGGNTVWFTSRGVVLAQPSGAVRLLFEGASPEVEVVGADRLPGVVSYFRGADPAEWHTAIPTYDGIVYEGLYPGIDAHYEGNGGELKSTFVVDPGADPSLIQWRHEGAESVAVDEASGDLVIELAGSTLVEQAPIAWQEVDGERVSVPASYNVGADGTVTFGLGSYDPAYPLVIDPVLLAYSTYLGGTGFDEADGLVLDGEGNVYMTGATTSPDFPIFDPATGYVANEDAFVVKLNAAGDTLVYAVYLGGCCDDDPNGIGVDADGNIYIAGDTDSKDLPTTGGAPQPAYGGADYDAFAAKLDAGGNLAYCTYLGAKGRDEAEGIAVDYNTGEAYIAGTTFSDKWLAGTYSGDGDAFAVKLNADGTWGYGRYLGGAGYDTGWGVAVEGGNAYLSGDTYSDDFPLLNPLQATYRGNGDVFVSKLDNAANLVYSTYLGGTGDDYNYDIAVDADGNAYLTGQTESADFPTTAGAFDEACGLDGACDYENGEDDYMDRAYTYGDAFVTKLNSDGDGLVYSTYLGGSGLDKAYTLVVDERGNAYITGDTFSKDFPAWGSPTPRLLGFGGETDAFVTKLFHDGSRLDYSVYLGGGLSDYGTGIAVDSDGNTIVGGITLSFDFPTKNALQDTHAGGIADSFIVKLIHAPAVVGGATSPLAPAALFALWAVGVGVMGIILVGGSLVLIKNRRL